MLEKMVVVEYLMLYCRACLP